MTKTKLIYLILIILILAVFVFNFVYWLKYLKIEPEITPETEPKIDSSTLEPVEPATPTGSGGGSGGNFIEEP